MHKQQRIKVTEALCITLWSLANKAPRGMHPKTEITSKGCQTRGLGKETIIHVTSYSASFSEEPIKRTSNSHKKEISVPLINLYSETSDFITFITISTVTSLHRSFHV